MKIFKVVIPIITAFLTISSYTMTSFAKENTGTWPEKVQSHKMILDVDMSTDVDDLSAIRISENLNKCGAQQLMAIGSCVTGGAGAVSGLLSADGLATIPVGFSSKDISDPSPYWEYLENLSPECEQMDAVSLYRKTLAESDSRVSIITTGFLSNIEALLESGPDEYSNLSGIDLVKQKVRAIHITGGTYTEGFDNNFGAYPASVKAADYVFTNWPENIPMLIYTNDLGARIQAGVTLTSTDPVRSCFILAGKPGTSAGWDSFTVWAFECLDYNLGDINGLSYVPCNIRMRTSTKENVFEKNSGKKVFRVIKTLSDNSFYQQNVSAYESKQ